MGSTMGMGYTVGIGSTMVMGSTMGMGYTMGTGSTMRRRKGPICFRVVALTGMGSTLVCG